MTHVVEQNSFDWSFFRKPEVGLVCFSGLRYGRYAIRPRGHVIHIEHATAGAYACLLYHGSLTWLISLLVQP